ncbi:MAG: hypothetical protein COX39_01780 [Candidatus Nealsonbacteria bacterium CG23_combo_of_CG06-09_8_20_14_all_40_13]|uniref:Uncharacterized protein n=1 Tax=Candidatus Nealsonbacteria bacterium CG23_combo_of_CG06-09_8_20_14_all_40_13 TaxID=1974724 RepID=A0A2G9YQW6_9BACT|nr:MAG: hypothetical protein COX39_01780 [Candidatus Nealsonbacteria bacterium CG23_combo_of_CG06-09_8_20_14_all_40_13]PIR71228.1 MAG: hypothetical protein COU44_00650 [Candidatus Nealsonbacteria bacterium CG10_big_fil_rev_8_21_14_0_10_40_24]PIU43313.1 MAG: hypothetical protein COS97_01620 [Candidatus Nealsonbacteria bacterium CG07_land_8_20_14_0_80_40_10]
MKVLWSLKSFKNRLYTALLSYDNDTNTSKGLEVWRTANGTSWEKVASGGFGDINNLWAITIEEFNDFLYIGTFNFNLDIEVGTGAEVWRSLTGDSGTWTQTNADGFGDTNNFVIYMMAAYKGYLYVGVWYYNESSEDWIRFYRTSDGQNWSQVDLSGLSSGSGGGSSLLMPLVVNDTFWMGNSFDTGGAGLYYSSNVANWQQEGERGFGDANNIDLFAMTLFKNYLYVSFGNNNGAQIWRSGPINPLSILTTSLLAAKLGSSYSANIDISSGTSPYICSYTGDLPQGLSLSSSCVISGIPTQASDHTFTVYVRDSGIPAQTTSKTFNLTVIPVTLPETGSNNQNNSWILLGGLICLGFIYSFSLTKLKKLD